MYNEKQRTVDSGVADPSTSDANNARVIAKASMLAGIASVFLFFSLLGALVAVLASLLGIVALVKTRYPAKGNSMAIAGVCLGVAGVVACGIFLAICFVIEDSRKVSCSSDIHQLKLALQQYAGDNGGYFPSGNGVEGLEMLRSSGYLSDYKVFICPSTGTAPASSPASLSEENVSYIYLGSGLKDSPENADKPLVCDKPDNHRKYGNVLFCDGHVQGYPGTKWLEDAKRAASEGH